MRAHAYIVSRLVWVTDPPPFDEFVLGRKAESYLTDAERTQRDAAAFDAWLAKLPATPEPEA